MTVGERIRERREALGWTQERLAEAIGVPREVLVKIENGSTGGSVGRRRAEKIAGVRELRLSVVDLLPPAVERVPLEDRVRTLEEELRRLRQNGSA